MATTQTSQPPDPFGAQGGGHWTGAQWVPKNHPLAGAAPDGTPAPGAGGGTPAAPPPAPGEGPTTPPGTPQRPSAMPPSPPPAATPAPQIPLGTPGANGPRQIANGPRQIDPGLDQMHGGRVTGPGLLDASQQGPPAGTPAAADPIDAAYRAALMDMLSQNPNEASVTDADIAPQARAQRAAIERSALKNRAGLMERASTEGIADTEATRAAGRQIETEAGQRIGEGDAALIGQKLESRRAQLNQAIQIANARGMQREANDLQRQLANLDAELKTRGIDVTREGYEVQRQLATLDANTKQYLADLDGQLRQQGYSTQERLAALDAEVRRYGIDTQGRIGSGEIDLRRELGIGELNLGYLQALMQNQQAGNRLGFDIGAWQSTMNKDALIAALTGGG
jgi:hypothetical protein